uniref:CS domain-containing protein n=1 Tax=Chlamydomonas leiostraca TaxID=1034604 RepID=A0A7S0RK40_9CHLO|mmetsp:Transcript_2514/g.6461  ORF Transcript_2514/g.6461 Transcript_2514/m.6461 type:complete len:175 (+) Transcript_2514:133-657(+)|eukprot:CAMPEP_0202860544 /NCGR_PEP_ID=MMETSP1391-20130828/2209_1 /ASSEMBLY_ACC=CAM_ASM_000867 /TAXON_ID=1034604 /ORGANISM="Chlamydomonas leiostraca, Strain SAG 11-49" /LENGTH=174 /DNA_ID=CAMNT_0049539727 /DNA_START=133 /DNA_END=657 /DNA_ORIENTATION=-
MAPSGDQAVAAQEAGSQAADAAQQSALHANIQAKGQNAYYYAHQKRNTGEEPAPMPVHIVLESKPIEAAEPIEPVTSGYLFSDEGSTVKVYLPCEGVGAKCSSGEARVSSSFEPKSLCLDIRGMREGGRVIRLSIKEMAGAVEPDECSHKVLANKVVLTLKKASSGPWSKLTAK